MSYWTYVHGTVVVRPMGRTQAEKRYILDTVLDHLPIISGSEEDVNIYTIQKNGTNSSSSHDEFWEITNNLKDRYGNRNRERGWLDVQSEYILVLDGSLRDRMFEDTYKEFQKWICRLAKRINVIDIQVKITGWRKEIFITNPKPYDDMYEITTEDGRIENWCEYLMWDYPRDENGNLLRGKPTKYKLK